MAYMNWQRRHRITNPQRRYWEAAVGGGVTYQISPVPFRGWQASRQEGNQCILPGMVKTKAEAVAWCEADFAQREMQWVGIA
jgi:hypothetical protein